MNLKQYSLPYLSDTSSLLLNLKALGGVVALDSNDHKHVDGRWSVISAEPVNELIIGSEISDIELTKGLEKLKHPLPVSNSDLPFSGGVIGHAAYDLGTPGGFSPKSRFEEPLLIAGLYTWAFIFDHANKECTLINWEGISKKTSNELIDIYSQSKPISTTFNMQSAFSPLWSKALYKKKFNAIQDYIASGDVYQVNLTQCFKAKYNGEPLIAYKALKDKVKAPFACYFEGDDFQFCSVSPELFIRSSGQIVSTKPIKGTRPRSESPEIDSQLMTELSSSQKDRAENVMIVDLLRNDLSKHCTNVKVDKLFDVESFSTVHHLVSTISGELNKSSDIINQFVSALPGGSITGAPKKRAMEIIEEIEQHPRSFYCGSTFYWSSNGTFCSNILIRSFLFKNKDVYCWGGGGMVADSKWDEEHQESLDKVSRLMQSISET